MFLKKPFGISYIFYNKGCHESNSAPANARSGATFFLDHRAVELSTYTSPHHPYVLWLCKKYHNKKYSCSRTVEAAACFLGQWSMEPLTYLPQLSSPMTDLWFSCSFIARTEAVHRCWKNTMTFSNDIWNKRVLEIVGTAIKWINCIKWISMSMRISHWR